MWPGMFFLEALVHLWFETVLVEEQEEERELKLSWVPCASTMLPGRPPSCKTLSAAYVNISVLSGLSIFKPIFWSD